MFLCLLENWCDCCCCCCCDGVGDGGADADMEGSLVGVGSVKGLEGRLNWVLLEAKILGVGVFVWRRGERGDGRVGVYCWCW